MRRAVRDVSVRTEDPAGAEQNNHCILSRSKYEKSKALVAENRQSSDLVSAELDHALSQVSREKERYDMLQQYTEKKVYSPRDLHTPFFENSYWWCSYTIHFGVFHGEEE